MTRRPVWGSRARIWTGAGGVLRAALAPTVERLIPGPHGSRVTLAVVGGLIVAGGGVIGSARLSRRWFRLPGRAGAGLLLCGTCFLAMAVISDHLSSPAPLILRIGAGAVFLVWGYSGVMLLLLARPIFSPTDRHDGPAGGSGGV